MTPWLQEEICNLTLSKQITLIKKHHQVTKKFALLFNFLQTSQVKRKSSLFNRKPAKHYDNISSKIKQEIGSHVLIHGTKAAIDHFSKDYTKYFLKRTTVSESKKLRKIDENS